MNTLKPKLKYFVLAIIIIAIDLYTKRIANGSLEYAQPFQLTNFFNLTLVYNHGAAFSLLSDDQTQWQLIIFSTISLLASMILTYLIIKCPVKAKLKLISFSLILGGALGNFYGRAFRGYVIDFLDFHINTYYWPVFNIADLTISCGIILLISHSFLKKDSDK